jgi:glycosyltransferase involved in cell wall biosynthesis
MTVAITDRAGSAASGRSPVDRSISVIVTAMNEEGNLRPAVESVIRAIGPRCLRYEVIIIDDGSTDRTFEIAQSLAAGNPRIRVHRNVRNLGLGRSYRTGIDLATFEYTSWVAGNNMLSPEALERVYDRVGERDLVISYILRDVRPFNRRVVSRAFTLGMNLLFSVNMRYYTGPCVFRTGVAKRFPPGAEGSLFVAELIVRLLRERQTYVEVGLQPLPRSSGSTKTFRLENVVNVFGSILLLFWELRVRRVFQARKAVRPRNVHSGSEPAARPRSSRSDSVVRLE